MSIWIKAISPNLPAENPDPIMTLILERFKALKLNKKIIGLLSNKADSVTLNKLASITLLLVLLPISFMPIGLNKNDVAVSDIKLTLDMPSVLAVDTNISTIKPGESLVERENRLKAEAAAKAKAEAQAKARLALARNTVSREYRTYTDPSDFDSIYSQAASIYGVDARILRAVHLVETGGSGSTSRANPSGATGPMQFLPSTWKRHGVDGNGDGVADINNVVDAIHSAAKYLKACGYPDVKKALWGYNPSTSYYNKVMNIAHSLGF